MRLPLLTLTALFLSAASAIAVNTAAGDPDAPTPYTLSPLQPAKLAACNVLSVTIHTTMAQSAKPIQTAVMQLYAKLQQAHIAPTGGPVIIFKNPQNSAQPTDIEIAVPVPQGTTALDGTTTHELPSIPTITTLYRGPFSALSQGYADFFTQVSTSGKIPGTELRQRTLYYETPTSPNNIVLIEMQTQ